MPQRILIIEPSPFRRAETHVRGPYGRLRAWWEAHRLVRRHPFGEIRVVPATCTVMQGDRVLWSPRGGSNGKKKNGN